MDKFWKTGNIIYIGDPFGEAEELTKEQFDEEMLKRALIEIRAERDRRIQEVEWRVTRHRDEIALGLDPSEPILPLLEYIQALRDVPQQEGFPTDVVWPEPLEGADIEV